MKEKGNIFMIKIGKLMGEKWRKRDGYLTIELTMVFSVLFFSLLLILFIGMVLYQEVKLQSVAVQASERGSIIYSSQVSDMTTGVKTLEDFKERNPYRNVPLIDGGKNGKYESHINTYVTQQLGSKNILDGNTKNAGNFAEVENYIFAKRLKVNIESGYNLPVASIGEMFGQNGPFDVSTTATSAIVDSPDFVRNTDLVMDMVKQTKVFADVESGFNKIMEAIESLGTKLQ